MPNIVKYALGLRGDESRRSCLPRPVVAEHMEETYAALRFTQPEWTQGVRFILEASTDLVNWTEICGPAIRREPFKVGTYNWHQVWVYDEVPIDHFSRRFLRLRILHYGDGRNDPADLRDPDPDLPWRLAEMIQGEGIDILDARYTGYMGSSDCFRGGIYHGLTDHGENDEVPWSMDEGIILTTGLSEHWNQNSFGASEGNWNDPETDSEYIDSDLETWMVAEGFGNPWFLHYDAVSLEIDFVPQHENVEVAFLFGSEEYYEASAPYNDAMAIFIGKLDNDGEVLPHTWTNIGVLPESETPSDAVAVYNIGEVVNHPNDLSNNLFGTDGYRMFYNNSGDPDHHLNSLPASLPPYGVTYSGFTRRFIALAENLNPSENYRLKIVVADEGDTDWDSGLFVERESLRSIP